MRTYTAPELPLIGLNDKTVFLGGSIEMGVAEQWQEDFVEACKILPNNWVLLNPRRKQWDSSWLQSIENPHFYQQVDWEMTYLGRATYRLFYFAPGTISPITLLELGKYGNGWDTFVVCPEGYERKGNVDMFCHHHQIPVYKNLSHVVEQLKKETES